ncbi:MAG: DNA-processing protein DprA [Clostridiales bacterium]|nr:DNA-processing protein DprA [Clostridiales bacterium]
MEERDLRLLEHTAIRYETPMDYRALREMESSGLIYEDSYPVIDDIVRLKKDAGRYGLSDRTKFKLSEVISEQSKVKTAVERYASLVEKYGIKIVSRQDKDYPFSWKELSGMPPLFFARGDTSVLSGITYSGAAAIVGSRDAGRYSLYATDEFSSKLSSKGAVIVSGMALGIDRKAHESCLNAGGKTVAVIPGGADVIYPYKNRDIYERICNEGVVITELPPGQEVLKQYFPSRNRLISALSDVCLIMEAGIYSGTLHTASFAATQGRDVFVLPNSIYADNSLGGLLLLRDGAEVLIDPDTVYERIMTEVSNRRVLLNEHDNKEPDRETLLHMARSSPDKLNESQWQSIVCDEISEKPRNIDELCRSLGIPFSYLSSVVTGLETSGRIINDRGKYVLTINGR